MKQVNVKIHSKTHTQRGRKARQATRLCLRFYDFSFSLALSFVDLVPSTSHVMVLPQDPRAAAAAGSCVTPSATDMTQEQQPVDVLDFFGGGGGGTSGDGDMGTCVCV